jgi:hypothetical protein
MTFHAFAHAHALNIIREFIRTRVLAKFKAVRTYTDSVWHALLVRPRYTSNTARLN